MLASAEDRYRRIARPSVFSHQRLLLTLWENAHRFNQRERSQLANEIKILVDSEKIWRQDAIVNAIQSSSDIISVSKNDFSVIDDKVCVSRGLILCLFSDQ
jgi:hypothetical protein